MRWGDVGRVWLVQGVDDAGAVRVVSLHRTSESAMTWAQLAPIVEPGLTFSWSIFPLLELEPG